jgi:hypothetical protein
MTNGRSIEQLIRESSQKALRQRKEFSLFSTISISVMEKLFPDVDMQEIIGKLEKLIPSHLFDEIDEIFVGSFGENDDRALEAHYESGAIYITSDLPTSMDYVENIVHETAHSLESARGLEIYGDRRVEKEFLGKRQRLQDTLKSYEISTDHLDFKDPEYSQDLDLFFYKKIGYDNLSSMTMGLFASPYGATSLREYFANGFEEYFLGNRAHLKRISPQLFIKIMEIINNDI